MNIFVGNLLFETNEENIRGLFSGFGLVESVSIVMDKNGIKSRGFGFVVMPDEVQAQEAIKALDGRDFMGRVINVSPARPKSDRDLERISKRHIKIERGQRRDNGGEDQRNITHDMHPGRNFSRGGRFRSGRRTRSFLRRRLESGVSEPYQPKPKNKFNPMRWRKKTQSRLRFKKDSVEKPWQKENAEAKPWQKRPPDAKPWERKTAGVKPWQKKESDTQPWRKPKSGSRPWRGNSPGSSRFQKRRQSGK